jgi:uncharacterized protein (TIGR03086 family)
MTGSLVQGGLMSTGTTSSTDSTDSTAPFAHDDPRVVMAKAVHTAGGVIAAIGPDQLDAPTPCREYDVRKLLGHLVGVLHRAAVVGRGEDPLTVPEYVDGVADGAWGDAWHQAAHQLQAAWTDDATLARKIDLSWAEMTGGEGLVMWAGEVTTHTWDLATATGQAVAWDDQVVAAGLASIRGLLPAEGRMEAFDELWKQLPPELADAPKPFAAAVPVPGDAPLIDQLVAFSGRRPPSAR